MVGIVHRRSHWQLLSLGTPETPRRRCRLLATDLVPGEHCCEVDPVNWTETWWS